MEEICSAGISSGKEEVEKGIGARETAKEETAEIERGIGIEKETEETVIIATIENEIETEETATLTGGIGDEIDAIETTEKAEGMIEAERVREAQGETKAEM